MSISLRDVKLLWGRAASRCSICGLELTPYDEATSSGILIGEQAHIVAEDLNGPRGNSPLTPEQRNSYSNHILLCPNHHTEIDKDVIKYSIEFLHWIKDDHEMRMLERTTPRMNNLRPFTDLLEFVSIIRPLQKYLYRYVPAQDAPDFFESLQRFWASRNLSIENTDCDLTGGIECLIRPLTSNHAFKMNSNRYPYKKLYQANVQLSDFAKKVKSDWFDFLEDSDELSILRVFSMNFESLLQASNGIGDPEYKALQHALFVSEYFQKCLKEGNYVEVPESLVNQLFDCITPYFEKLGFRLPVLPLEDNEILWLRTNSDYP